MFLFPCQYCTFFGEKADKNSSSMMIGVKTSSLLYGIQYAVKSSQKQCWQKYILWYSVDQDISAYQKTVKYFRIQSKLKYSNAKKTFTVKGFSIDLVSNPLSQIFATIKRATTPINDFCNHKEYIEPPISMVLKKKSLECLESVFLLQALRLLTLDLCSLKKV